MRSIRLLCCGAIVAALVALVGCSSNTKTKTAQSGPPAPLKDAPKDSLKPSSGYEPPDPGKFQDSKRMRIYGSAKDNPKK